LTCIDILLIGRFLLSGWIAFQSITNWPDPQATVANLLWRRGDQNALRTAEFRPEFNTMRKERL
jgi:hypothetical protein